MVASILNQISSRKFRIFLRRITTKFVPPFIIDNKLIANILFWLLFNEYKYIFINFKESIITLSQEKLNQLYLDLSNSRVEMLSSLNHECIQAIKANISGDKIIDVGCGNGLLLNQISHQGKYQLTGCDIVLSQVHDLPKEITLIQGSTINLPFPDKSFDTVISTHTLEHVLDIQRAISELRRIARKKLIVVVPCERPYRYTPDLHVHFFPYDFVLLSVFGFKSRSKCELLGGDWYYEEQQ